MSLSYNAQAISYPAYLPFILFILCVYPQSKKENTQCIPSLIAGSILHERISILFSYETLKLKGHLHILTFKFLIATFNFDSIYQFQRHRISTLETQFEVLRFVSLGIVHC